MDYTQSFIVNSRCTGHKDAGDSVRGILDLASDLWPRGLLEALKYHPWLVLCSPPESNQETPPALRAAKYKHYNESLQGISAQTDPSNCCDWEAKSSCDSPNPTSAPDWGSIPLPRKALRDLGVPASASQLPTFAAR